MGTLGAYGWPTAPPGPASSEAEVRAERAWRRDALVAAVERSLCRSLGIGIYFDDPDDDAADPDGPDDLEIADTG